MLNNIDIKPLNNMIFIDHNIICTIISFSYLGNNEFSYIMPNEINKNGISIQTWTNLIYEANNAIKYNWFHYFHSLCCLFIPYKNISDNMNIFCNRWNNNKNLPTNIYIKYEIEIKTNINNNHSKKISEIYHKLIFYKK